MPEHKKSPFKSLTFWFNLLVVASSSIAPQVIEAVPPEAAWAGIVIGIANFLLRFKTKTPIV